MSPVFSRPTVTLGIWPSFQNEDLSWSSAWSACLPARRVSEGANTHSTTHSALLIALVLPGQLAPGRQERLAKRPWPPGWEGGDPGGDLGPGGEAELGEDVLHVVFGGPLRDHQLGGDLLAAGPGCPTVWPP